MKSIYLSLALAAVAATSMPTAAVAAKAKLKTVSVGIHTQSHRGAPPLVHVKFSNGRWRLAHKNILFDLWVYAKANVGTGVKGIYVTAPADGAFTQNRWKAGSKFPSKRKLKVNHSHHAMPQNALGKYGLKLIDYCKKQLPGGVGQFRKKSSMPVKIGVSMIRGGLLSKLKFYYKTKIRSIRITIYCDGGKAAPRSASAPKPAKVSGAGVKLTKFGTHCPRKVFASVRVWTTKPTKVKYTLHSSRGGKWTYTLNIQFKNASGKYEGRFDHTFMVKKSTNMKFWIRIKGKKYGRPAFLKVNCITQGPKNMTN